MYMAGQVCRVAVTGGTRELDLLQRDESCG